VINEVANYENVTYTKSGTLNLTFTNDGRRINVRGNFYYCDGFKTKEHGYKR
jgi:hypothetical protein